MCSSTASPEVDLCRVTLGVATSDTSQNYMEVWMPTEWNGRFMATDNKGLAGCTVTLLSASFNSTDKRDRRRL